MPQVVRISWVGNQIAGKSSKSNRCNTIILSFAARRTVGNQNFNQYALSRIPADCYNRTDIIEPQSIMIRFGLEQDNIITIYSSNTLVTEIEPIMRILSRIGMEIAAISYFTGNFVSNISIIANNIPNSCHCFRDGIHRTIKNRRDNSICTSCIRDILPVAVIVLERGGAETLIRAVNSFEQMSGRRIAREKEFIRILCQSDGKNRDVQSLATASHWREVLDFAAPSCGSGHSYFCTVPEYCPGKHSGILPILSALIDQYLDEGGLTILNQIRRLLTIPPLGVKLN